MKKIICALLALILLAGALSGCSKEEETDSPSTPQASSQAQGDKGIQPYKLGIVQYIEYAPLDEARQALMSRLDEWGLDDGKMQVDYQNAGGSTEKAASICEKFVKNKVDVIVAISTPAAKAAVEAAAGGDTKVVFLGVSDPKTELGLENPQQPAGNLTGVADLTAAQAAVDLALQVDPNLKAAGLLYDPACPFGAAYVKAFKEYCASRNITVVESQAANAGQAPQCMADLCGQVGAVFTPVDNTVAAAAAEAAKTARDAGKPWYASTQDIVLQGGMACISIDYTEAGNKAADMAVQLAAGRKASELPVYSFGSGQVSVNQETMAALSAQIPEEILGTAIYCQPQAPAA